MPGMACGLIHFLLVLRGLEMIRLSRGFLGAMVLLSGMSEAQGGPDVTRAPIVAREYLEAVRADGFAAEARFMHPDELARFQGLLIPVFEADQAAGSRALLNATFGRDAAMLDVRLSDPVEFMRRFARVMAVRMPDQPVGFDELRVLGMVEEGARVHVLVRLLTVSESASEEDLEVVTLLPDGDEWKLTLGPKLEAAVRSMDRKGRDRRPTPRLVPSTPPPEAERPGAEAADRSQ